MKKFTSLFTLICAMFITTATAQVNQTVVFNFANNAFSIPTDIETSYIGKDTEGVYTDGINTIEIKPDTTDGKKGKYYFSNNYVRLSKKGSKIILPAFDFDVEKIEVVGHDEAKNYKSHGFNIFLNGNAICTEVTGLQTEHTFEIAPEHQAKGNIYEIAVSTGNYIFISCIKVYPAATDDALTITAPVFDHAPGVYTSPITVKVSSPTAEIEGVKEVTYYYTTENGYEPDSECDEIEDGEITISETCTLKVILEFKYGENYYTSESTAAEYIISKEVTCEKATTVKDGKYFIVANGNIALPFENSVLPTKETTVEDDNVSDAEYYAYTIEEDGNGKFYIKDANGLYLTTLMGEGKKEGINSFPAKDYTEWNIAIENEVAKITKDEYILVYRDNKITAIKVANVTTTEVFPTLYTVPAAPTAIEGVNADVEKNAIYDLTGRRIDEIVKPGIYIVGGKKVLVK